MTTQTCEIAIDGMTCGGCVNSVQDSVKQLAGVGEINVSLQKGRATVTFDDEKLSTADILIAIDAAGFDVALV